MLFSRVSGDKISKSGHLKILFSFFPLPVEPVTGLAVPEYSLALFVCVCVCVCSTATIIPGRCRFNTGFMLRDQMFFNNMFRKIIVRNRKNSAR